MVVHAPNCQRHDAHYIGWPHAVVTPEDSVVVGGNFLHGLDMGRQLDVWKLEQRLGVRDQFRFPKYKTLMYHTAAHYVDLLRTDIITSSKEGTIGRKSITQAPSIH